MGTAIALYVNKQVRSVSRTIWLFAVAPLLLLACGTHVIAEEPLWEYSPYKVEVWLAIDSEIGLSEQGRGRLERDLKQRLEVNFQAAWDLRIVQLEGALKSLVLSKTSELTLDTLESLDLVLALPKKNPATDSFRTVESVLENVASIECSETLVLEIQKRLKEEDSKSIFGRLRDKLHGGKGSIQSITAEVADGKIQAAVITKEALASRNSQLRTFPLRLPWQMEVLQKTLDKIFIVSINRAGEDCEFVVKEFDCATRSASPVYRMQPEYALDRLGTPLANLVTSAFAPLVRIEDNEGSSAKLRGRALGLITQPDHPASLHIGDVLQPILRRNDRNGSPTLLEPIPWTFLCVTKIDGFMLDGHVLSGVRGGLPTRKNKRIQQMALRVRPLLDHSDLQIVSPQTPDLPLSGCEVYAKQPGSDDLELVGRTDWRGILRLKRPAELPTLTIPPPVTTTAAPSAPEASNAAPPAGETVATDASAEKNTTTSQPASPTPDQKESDPKKADKPTTPVAPSEPAPKLVPLRAPLWVFYVKNGDTLLARLPTVIGFKERLSADVANDSRRLEAEAYIRGIQSEIIDVVATRALLAARIRSRIKSGKYDDAEKIIGDLRSTRDYKKMADDLDLIQRRVLDASKGPLAPTVQSRIDRMFQQTRDLLQKYLQDDLVRKLEKELEEARKGPPPAEEKTGT